MELKKRTFQFEFSNKHQTTCIQELGTGQNPQLSFAQSLWESVLALTSEVLGSQVRALGSPDITNWFRTCGASQLQKLSF